MRLGGSVELFCDGLYLLLTIENFANGLGVNRRIVSAHQPKAVRNFNGNLIASGLTLFNPKISYAFSLTLTKTQGAILEAIYNTQQTALKERFNLAVRLVDNRQSISENQPRTRAQTDTNIDYYAELDTVDYFAEFNVLLVFGDDYRTPFGNKLDSYSFSAVEIGRTI